MDIKQVTKRKEVDICSSRPFNLGTISCTALFNSLIKQYNIFDDDSNS